MCIGEAVFVLMDKKEYEKIKISDIVKTAGVSRMTFYHYYETKEDALADYFHEIVADYVRECRTEQERIGRFHDRSSIIHALQYFDQFAVFINKLRQARLQYILWDAMNDYMCRRIMPKYQIPAYELYFYGGALLNVFLKWQDDGKKETAEEIADTIIRSMGLGLPVPSHTAESKHNAVNAQKNQVNADQISQGNQSSDGADQHQNTQTKTDGIGD